MSDTNQTDAQEPDDDTADEQHEHEGGCCSATPQQRMRGLAQAVRYQADCLQNVPGFDLHKVEALIRAAGILLDESGGRDNEEGVWLSCCEGALMQKLGNNEHAATSFKQAYELSRGLLGTEDPVTLGSLGNYGQFLVETGDMAGEPLLVAAIDGLRDAEPVRHISAAWLAGGVEEFSRTLAKFTAPKTDIADEAKTDESASESGESSQAAE